MSSTAYSAHLRTDRCLRYVVICSACLMGGVGVILIASMPLAAPVRIALCCVWLLASYFELRPYRRGYRAYTEIRVLAGGEVRLRNRHLEWVSGTLETGSVLLRRIGWLRFKTHDGDQFAELLMASGQQSREWRRLQLIWRHIGAAE